MHHTRKFSAQLTVTLLAPLILATPPDAAETVPADKAALIVASPPDAAELVSADEAKAIAVDAYIYFYPLVTMDLTRLQSTNVEPGKEPLRGPMNTFSNATAFPAADFKVVVRPNFDTLYSSGWVDLTHEPVIVS